MGADDKASNQGEKLKGKGKETVGKLTGNEKLEAEGKKDQTKSDVKQAGEKVKDTLRPKQD